MKSQRLAAEGCGDSRKKWEMCFGSLLADRQGRVRKKIKNFKSHFGENASSFQGFLVYSNFVLDFLHSRYLDILLKLVPCPICKLCKHEYLYRTKKNISVTTTLKLNLI